MEHASTPLCAEVVGGSAFSSLCLRGSRDLLIQPSEVLLYRCIQRMVLSVLGWWEQVSPSQVEQHGDISVCRMLGRC